MKPTAALALALTLALLMLATGPAPATERDPAKLQLASVHAAVAPLARDTNELLYARDAERAVPVASITKLMTAMVTLDANPDLDEWLDVVERDEKPPIHAVSRIPLGAQMRRGTLLRIMLMSSENLAAYTLADNYPGGFDAFIDAMNAKSSALGMAKTQWVNPSGLTTKNVSSAADIVTMVRAAFSYKLIREYTQTGFFTAYTRSPRRAINYGNTDPLVHRRDWDIRLTKTGYLNAAGRCLTVVVTVDDTPYIMVFLNAFGKLSPIGDVGRTARWLREGDGGPVARAARRYAEREQAEFARRDRLRALVPELILDPELAPMLARCRRFPSWLPDFLIPDALKTRQGNSLAAVTNRCSQ